MVPITLTMKYWSFWRAIGTNCTYMYVIKCTSRLYVTCPLDGLYMLRWQSSAPDRRYSPLSFHAIVFTWKYNKTFNLRFRSLLHSENTIHSQNTNWIINTTKNVLQKLSLKVYTFCSYTDYGDTWCMALFG